MTTLQEQFRAPGPAWRGKPFWAWNGKLDKAELLRQVHVMKAMGFGGFFMHSRTGLATEYLGDEWFDLINACADEAEKLGLEPWLYDEDRWPSGLAGGFVTQHPEYRARSVVLDILAASEWVGASKREGVLAMFLARVDGLDFSECERLPPRRGPGKGECRKLLVFRVVETPRSDFYNGFTYVDTLNPEATRLFLKLTHEQYRRHCGKRLGRSIKGIFTDEPHRGRLMIRDAADPASEWSAPWTAKVPERFRRDFGYDLLDCLPDLFLRRDGERVSQVKWHFVECLNRMFLDHFARPYAEWCRRHDLKVTGHVLHEDNLGAQTAMNGSLMRYYEHMDCPGVDLLTRNNRCYWVAKQVASAARQLGRKWVLSEMYGASGWDMPFSDHKALGDWQALFGINIRCHHLSWYTMEGEAKRDYPASMIHHSTWWDSYDTVERYFGRMGLLMAQGRPACEVLVLNPVESVWCQVHAGWAVWLQTDSKEIQPVEDAYRELFFTLSEAQVDFDYGDEEMMSRLASVRRTSGGTRLRVGQAEYRVVVVPRMVTMRATTVRLLERFRAAGGVVLFSDAPPAYVDARPSPGGETLAGRCRCVPSGGGAALVAAIDEAMGGAHIRLSLADGSPLRGVFAQMRHTREGAIVMVVNTDKERGLAGVRVRIRVRGQVQEWNCLDGTRRSVPTRQRGDYLEFDEDLAAGGEKAYVIKAVPEAGLSVRRPVRALGCTTWRGRLQYRLNEPNVCVMDWARYRIDGGRWSGEMEILKADREVRGALGIPLRGGEMLQPWWVNRGNGGRPVVRGRVAFQYGFDIARIPVTPLDLVIENPGGWTIRLNGVALNPVTAAGWWVDVTMQRLPIPPQALRLGANVVEIETGFHYGTNPEAMFVLGDFGVTLEGRRRVIGALSPELKLGDIVPQGLPFYSGKVVYRLPVNGIRRPRGARAVLCLKGMGGACARVGVAGQESLVIPWAPYEADVTAWLESGAEALDLEVVTTRRNSFGPLHQWPPDPNVATPGSFLTEGATFRDEYVLLPAGLLAAPELHWRR